MIHAIRDSDSRKNFEKSKRATAKQKYAKEKQWIIYVFDWPRARKHAVISLDIEQFNFFPKEIINFIINISFSVILYRNRNPLNLLTSSVANEEF